MFRVASENNIDVYTDSVSKFIKKCIRDVVPTVTIKTFPDQTPWIDGSIRHGRKSRTTAFNHGKATGNMAEYKQCSYSLHKEIKQAKYQYRDKVELQFNSSNTRHTVCDRVYRQSRITKRKPAPSQTSTFCFQTN